MTPRARHLQEMKPALAERISLAAARHRLAELRLRAGREARAKAREGLRTSGLRPSPESSPKFWWKDHD